MAEDDDDLAFLAPALRFLRQNRGSSQVEVAKKAGITKAMLSSYERGKQIPNLPTLMKLLKAQSYSLADLHGALQLVKGEGIFVPMPEIPLPAWVRPLVMELIRQIVTAVGKALEETDAEEA